MTKTRAKKVKVGDILRTKMNSDGVSFKFIVESIETKSDVANLHEYIFFKGTSIYPTDTKVSYNHKEIFD